MAGKHLFGQGCARTRQADDENRAIRGRAMPRTRWKKAGVNVASSRSIKLVWLTGS